MNLLAIDTACSVLSIAAAKGGEILYTETDAGTKHSEIIMYYIDSLMKEISLKPQDLNGILCMGGPGSFTGLRIGYSIAKGLALSLSIPFIPIPTLDCITYQLQMKNEQLTGKLVLSVIESRKGSFYYAFYKDGERLTADADGTAGQIAEALSAYPQLLESNPLNPPATTWHVTKNIEKSKKIILTGPAASLLYDTLPPGLKAAVFPDSESRGYAKELIFTAKNKKLFDNDNSAFLYAGPQYVRKTDAELSQK